MLLRTALGRCLRILRVSQGRTLEEIAVSAGVSLAHLSAIERGVSESSSEILAAICSALGVKLADLLDIARDELTDRTETERDYLVLAA